MRGKVIVSGGVDGASGASSFLGFGGGDPQNDLRLVGLGSDLWAYYDLRPTVSDAPESATMSSTLAVSGTTQPVVTLSGPLSPPRDIRIQYPVGGLRGTATYRITADAGSSSQTIYTGTTSASAVDIGGGNSISFGDGGISYTAHNGTNPTTATMHQSQVVSWEELTGLANATLTDLLSSGHGHRFEAYGLNSRLPSLFMNQTVLANEDGVPAKVTGTDTPFEVWMLYESWRMINSSNAMFPWAFNNKTDANTKSYIECVMTGPLHATPRRMGTRRKDSSGSPLEVSMFTDQYSVDAGPHVHRSIVSDVSDIFIDGKTGRSATVSLDRGVATNLDRFVLGGSKRGTAALTGLCSGRVTALALTAPLSNAKALSAALALAGNF